MRKPNVTIPEDRVLPIVGDAAIAGPIADGRLIPVLILDTAARPEVAELIRMHEHLPPGDVLSQWAHSRDDSDVVALQLRFLRPVETALALRFGMEAQAILVETMLDGGAVYLQAGVAGDRLMNTLDAPRVLVELPDTGFRPVWDEILLTRITVVMSRRLGISRKKARPLAKRPSQR